MVVIQPQRIRTTPEPMSHRQQSQREQSQRQHLVVDFRSAKQMKLWTGALHFADNPLEMQLPISNRRVYCLMKELDSRAILDRCALTI